MTFLEEGDVFELKEGMPVYADIPEHFVYTNRRGSFALTHSSVRAGGDNFGYLLGTYIVTKTTHDGGGQGHGPGDTYPNGHHVWCVKADEPGRKVDFYQSGSFTAMNENIEKTGKAELRWTL